VKSSEVAAASLGINVFHTKLFVFAISGMLGGLAGSLIGPLTGYLSPDQYDFNLGVSYLAMAILGGTGSFWGPAIGATFVTTLPVFLSGLRDYAALLWGFVFLIGLIVSPNGAIGAINAIMPRRAVSRAA